MKVIGSGYLDEGWTPTISPTAGIVGASGQVRDKVGAAHYTLATLINTISDRGVRIVHAAEGGARRRSRSPCGPSSKPPPDGKRSDPSTGRTWPPRSALLLIPGGALIYLAAHRGADPVALVAAPIAGRNYEGEGRQQNSEGGDHQETSARGPSSASSTQGGSLDRRGRPVRKRSCEQA